MSFLNKEFIRLAGRAVHDFQMIGPGDGIIVGLSGGKDSLALLKYLADRRARVPIHYSVVAVHLDMGYEDPAQAAELKSLVEAMGLVYHFEPTDFARLAHSDINRENPCFLCSRLRRRRLFELARDFGCAKVALGHHREDLIETLWLNILYAGEISTMRPVQPFFDGLITVIRPLCFVPEDTVRRWVLEVGLPVFGSGCPSHDQSKRREVKDWLNQLDRANDKIKGNIFRALSNWRPEYLLPAASRPGRRSTRRLRSGRSMIRPRTAAAELVVSGESNATESKEPSIMTDENKRKRTRVNFKTRVTLQTSDRKLMDLASRDLSLKGLFVETDQKLPLGTPVDISLELAGATSLVSLKMKGKVARLVREGLGVDFVEIDLDSFYHLRNIIMYNTSDPNEIDDELVTKPAF